MPIIILSLVILLSSGLIQGHYFMLGRTQSPHIAGRLGHFALSVSSTLLFLFFIGNGLIGLYAYLNGIRFSSVLALSLFCLISFLFGTLYYLHQAEYLGGHFPSLRLTAAAKWLFYPVIAAFVIFPLVLCFDPYFEGLNQNQLVPWANEEMLHLVAAYGLGLLFSLFNSFRRVTTLSAVPRVYLATIFVIAVCEFAILIKIADSFHAHSMERTCVESVFVFIGFIILYIAAKTERE